MGRWLDAENVPYSFIYTIEFYVVRGKIFGAIELILSETTQPLKDKCLCLLFVKSRVSGQDGNKNKN